MQVNNINNWQALQLRLYELIARYPVMGITANDVATMRPDNLIGSYNLLNDYHAKNGV